MAEGDPIDSVEKLKQALESLRGPIGQMVETFKNLFDKGVSDGLVGGVQGGVEEAKKIAAKWASDLGLSVENAAASSLVKGIEWGFEQAKVLARNAAGQLERIFGAVKIGIDKIDPAELKQISSELIKFGTENAVQLAIMTRGENEVKRLLSPVADLEENIMKFSKATALTMQGFSGSMLKGQRDSEMFGAAINGANKLAVQSMKQLGISQEEAIKMFGEMGQAGVDMNRMMPDSGKPLIRLSLGAGTEELDQLSAVALLARGSAMETSEAFGILGEATQRLGYNADSAALMFGTFRQVQADSGLSAGEVRKNLMEGADALSMYGGNVESVAALYKNFIQTVGEGNRLLAGDVFKTVIKSLAGMNTEFRAFLGMTGASGGFGQAGVLGSALAVEDALKTGEGLDQIMEDLKAQVEKFGGGEIMDKETARAEGRENQYFLMRQLLGKFTNINDPAQLDKIMSMYAADQRFKTTDLATGREQAAMAVATEGGQVINQTMGPLEQSLNRARAVGADWIREMHQGFVDMGPKIQSVVQTAIVDPLMKMKDVARGQAGMLHLDLDQAYKEAPEYQTVETFNKFPVMGAGVEKFESASQYLKNGGDIGNLPQLRSPWLEEGMRPIDQIHMPPPLPTPEVPTEALLRTREENPASVETMQLKVDTPDPIQLSFAVDAGLQLRPIIRQAMIELWPQFDRISDSLLG